MLRLLEHYVSTQGEGPKVGKLTQFVRFAGCNLKCPGWPCDTPYAIDPRLFRKEQRIVSVAELTEMICRRYDESGAENICITGGEPLMQNQDDLVEVVQNSINNQHELEFEIFTNGTREIDPMLVEMCSFVMDWKLPGSGEDYLDQTRIGNVDRLNYSVNAIKFVIMNMNDLWTAKEMFYNHLSHLNHEIFVGAAWGAFSDAHIVEFVKENRLPWKLNVQVHNYIYGAQKRGI